MENTQVADVLEEIAELLALRDDNPFRVQSYRSAARLVRNLVDRIEDLAAQGKDLSEIANIGDSLAGKIHEILETGTCKRLEKLRGGTPGVLPELVRVPGIGPRKATRLHRALNIESLADLKKACENHEVRELEGMGEKTEQKILRGITTIEKTAGRILYSEAAEVVDALAAYLDSLTELNRWEIAGSFRRGKETIGDLDILVYAEDREKAAEALLRHADVEQVLGRGEERISVRLTNGLQVDYRFFDPESFGAAWLYMTGSKEHNIALRSQAQERGWKLNEYGLLDGDDRRLAGKTEEAVYRRFGQPWIPPELRENRGEIEVARDGTLPELITHDDVRGDLHCHTTESDGRHSIREMATAARDRGYEYLAITDHSKRVTIANGLDDDRALKHADAIRKVDKEMEGFRLLAGIEVDILKNGKLDLKEKTLTSLDWVVASVHYDRGQSRKAMTDRIVAAISSGVVHCLGHPLGRLIGRRHPIAIDLDRVFEACVEYGVRLEINGQPERFDLPDIHGRSARDAGVGFTLGTDAHSVDGFRYMAHSVMVARRGWLGKEDVLNTKDAERLKEAIHER